MISEALASKFLAPLWELFPRSEEAPEYQDLVTRTLAEACRDEAHARATVAQLVRTCRYKPLPVEVVEASSAVAPVVEPEAEEWHSNRQPGDEPFGGFHELVDDRVIAILRRKAAQEKASIEREAARRFLRSWESPKKPEGDVHA